MPLRVYYYFKPYLPRAMRFAVRRTFARRKRQLTTGVWPIDPNSNRKPEGWAGWPDGKQFAVVLTHDVEGPKGLERCRQLAALEAKLGFRSSFNLIPEGTYSVPEKLREDLARDGFEIGIHDLRHDGKLYWSEEAFKKQAERINDYVKEWKVTGFRSGFMHHNLDWLHELNVQYDSSTFDTDPFEPQPDGVGTIFPFWVSNPNFSGDAKRGYVELPYTLPQDSTLFLVFREQNIDIWKQKLDWVAAHGGMVMVNVHPDYMNFKDNKLSSSEFPAAFYQELLEYLRSKYQGKFWEALPRDVAVLTKRCHDEGILKSSLNTATPIGKSRSSTPRKIWIDLDNTPHIPFFEPIIEELKKRGHEILLTARDAFQVCELADQKGMTYLKIGRHHGKNRIRKVTGLLFRAGQLAPAVTRAKPDLAISHGSRSQILLANFLRIPSVILADYEFAKHLPLMRPTWEMVPEIIPNERLYCPTERIRKYPGIKEDVYTFKLKPNKELLPQLGLKFGDLIVTVRPPATEAHYHNPEAEDLFVCFMEIACRTPGVRVVLLPRNKKQGEAIQKSSPHWFADARTIIPKFAVDGLNLLWHSDLVVSGGGTMNREAAALGVPVYSIFRGPIGAVDRQLQKEGRLIMIESAEDVKDKIILSRRERKPAMESGSNPSLISIVEHIEEILETHYPNGKPS